MELLQLAFTSVIAGAHQSRIISFLISPHENTEYLKYFISETQREGRYLNQHRRKYMGNIKLRIKERVR